MSQDKIKNSNLLNDYILRVVVKNLENLAQKVPVKKNPVMK